MESGKRTAKWPVSPEVNHWSIMEDDAIGHRVTSTSTVLAPPHYPRLQAYRGQVSGTAGTIQPKHPLTTVT